jgi:hypothetical protein
LILFDLFPTEDDPIYQSLQVSNLDRQYDFLRSIVEASVATQRLYLSQTVVKAFNYHAIVCLHAGAGEFRPCEVKIGDGKHHQPPIWIHVQAQMDDFINSVNRAWENTDAVVLATYALWRLNWIHPFVNGNGRTARLTAYYILCLKSGGMLPGEVTLPDLLRRHRYEDDDPYVLALRAVDQSLATGAPDLSQLHALVSSLLEEQLSSAQSGGSSDASGEA